MIRKHQVLAGTSQATPVVAGSIALYLQKFPTASIADIRDALLQNALADFFAMQQGMLQNNHWGYGKLDILKVFTGVQVAVEEEGVVQQFTLAQNYPNPFNPVTTIAFGVPRAETVTLTVYNVLGQRVQTLIDDTLMTPGTHRIVFDGRHLSSGLYVYRIQAGDQILNRKMLLIK